MRLLRIGKFSDLKSFSTARFEKQNLHTTVLAFLPISISGCQGTSVLLWLSFLTVLGVVMHLTNQMLYKMSVSFGGC